MEKDVHVSVRMKSKDKDWLIETYGSVSAGVRKLVSKKRKQRTRASVEVRTQKPAKKKEAPRIFPDKPVVSMASITEDLKRNTEKKAAQWTAAPETVEWIDARGMKTVYERIPEEEQETVELNQGEKVACPICGSTKGFDDKNICLNKKCRRQSVLLVDGCVTQLYREKDDWDD